MDGILILIGTVTGNTEHVAAELAPVFEYSGLNPITVDMFDATPALVQQYNRVLICTSTHGDGGMPDNAERFYHALKDEAPSLNHVQFAVCALGDHDYDPYFCGAAITFERLFAQLGATPVAERFEIDGGPTEDDIEQAQAWSLDVVDAMLGVPA